MKRPKKIKFVLITLKFTLIFLFVSTILIVSSLILTVNRRYAYALPYKEPTITSIEYDIIRPPNINYEVLTEELNELFNNPSYTLSYTSFAGNVKGRCNIHQREIEIQEGLNFEYYVFCLTHELVHLTECNHNERYTNLVTFETLYTSGNEYFKNIALYFAELDLRGAFTEEYSFVGYLSF